MQHQFIRTRRSPTHLHTAFTLVEFIATIAIIVVILAVVMTVSGSLRRRPGHGASLKDKTIAMMLYKSMVIFGQDSNGDMPRPSRIALAEDGDADVTLDTTALLYSSLIAQNFFNTDICVSPNEPNLAITEMKDYDYKVWNPAASVFWDSRFKADLQTGSNVSYAHMPLWGEPMLNRWQTRTPGDANWPMLGSRGPLGGVHDPTSYTNKIQGDPDTWSGHVIFGDGHAETLDDLPPIKSGRTPPIDAMAIFRFDGENDPDGILTFTQSMTKDGPVIQHD